MPEKMSRIVVNAKGSHRISAGRTPVSRRNMGLTLQYHARGMPHLSWMDLAWNVKILFHFKILNTSLQTFPDLVTRRNLKQPWSRVLVRFQRCQ